MPRWPILHSGLVKGQKKKNSASKHSRWTQQSSVFNVMAIPERKGLSSVLWTFLAAFHGGRLEWALPWADTLPCHWLTSFVGRLLHWHSPLPGEWYLTKLWWAEKMSTRYHQAASDSYLELLKEATKRDRSHFIFEQPWQKGTIWNSQQLQAAIYTEENTANG